MCSFSTQKDRLPLSAKGSLGKELGIEALHSVLGTCSKQDIAGSCALFLCLCPATTLTVALFAGGMTILFPLNSSPSCTDSSLATGT